MPIYTPNEFINHGEDLVYSFLIAISDTAGDDSIYGYNIETPAFRMTRFCWCDEDTCPYCGPERESNFEHKRTGIKIWWYKYIGRDMLIEANSEMTAKEWNSILKECLDSIE